MTDHLVEGEYHLEWIPCRNLSVVWAESQRPYSPNRAKEIAANFDPELFDPLKVTLPNGNGIYHVCDGQTRKGAVEMLYGADERVPCLVAPEGDPVRAAVIFLKTNTSRRPPSMVDNFKVSVTAQLPNEVAIDKIVRHHGYHVGQAAQNAISAVSSLRHIFTVCGPTVLNRTLEMLRAIWDNDQHAVNGPMLRGFGVFINEFGDHHQFNHRRFIEITKKKWTPGSLLRDAKAGREVHGGSTTESIVQLLLVNYNRHSRTGAPLKRKESTVT